MKFYFNLKTWNTTSLPGEEIFSIGVHRGYKFKIAQEDSENITITIYVPQTQFPIMHRDMSHEEEVALIIGLKLWIDNPEKSYIYNGHICISFSKESWDCTTEEAVLMRVENMINSLADTWAWEN